MLSKINLPVWCQIALVGALISSGGLLFAQTHKKIDTKANKEVVSQMLEVIKIKQEMQENEIKEQDKSDKKLNDTLNELTKQMIILNERLKTP